MALVWLSYGSPSEGPAPPDALQLYGADNTGTRMLDSGSGIASPSITDTTVSWLKNGQQQSAPLGPGPGSPG